MWNRVMGSTVALAAIVAFSTILPAQTAPQSGEAKVKTAPAQPFDLYDLSGVWELQRQKKFTLSADPPPMTEWGQAKFNDTKPGYGPRLVPPAFGNDPIGNCDPSGYPRIMFDPVRPMEIVQLPGRLLQHFQYHDVWRTIWADGRPLPKDLDPLWNGYAVGKWEGDTFVIDSVGFDDRSWLDHFGDPHSDQMTLQERFRRVDHDTLQLTMALTDPKTYTKPWVSEMKTWKLNPKIEIEQEICVPSEEQEFNRRQRDPAGGKTGPGK